MFKEGISVLEKIYWILAVPFSVAFIIQLITAIIGLSGDQDSLEGTSCDDGIDPGLRLFSIRNIIIFFTVTGWAGIAGIHAGFNTASIMFSSFGLGFLMMYFYAKLFQHLMQLTESGTMVIENARGKTGIVYLRIPGGRSGTGKVTIELQGADRELDAMTDQDDIQTGESVNILDIIDNSVLLVEKLKKE